jgi:DNA-binding CsgD family transcriptional regulator
MAMPRATPAGHIIARIQRICCFGPGGQSAIPDVLRELAQHVPSRIAPAFFGMGQRFETTSFYSEGNGFLETISLYAREFEETRERDVCWLASEVFRKYYHSPVGEFGERRLKVSRGEFLRSEFYNEILRPFGFDRSLFVTIAGRARHLATVQFPRAADDPAFTKREIRLLEAVAPFIAHALMDRQTAATYVDGDDRALVIVDENGLVQHASREAQRLLLMARFCADASHEARTVGSQMLPGEVRHLCQRVAAWSDSNPLPAPPVWQHKNGWGEFIFRVFRTDQHTGLPTPRLIGISVERREPLRLKLLRRMGELPLSGRETELCLALLEGRSRAAIADRLGISETTAITHCRNLYAKLDVHNRMELAEKMQAM